MLFFLVSYGLCFGLQNDKFFGLSAFLRKWPFFEQMLLCAFCTGFHTGWLAWLLIYGPHHIHAMACWSMASAVFCYVFDVLLQWLEKSTTQS